MSATDVGPFWLRQIALAGGMEPAYRKRFHRVTFLNYRCDHLSMEEVDAISQLSHLRRAVIERQTFVANESEATPIALDEVIETLRTALPQCQFFFDGVEYPPLAKE